MQPKRLVGVALALLACVAGGYFFFARPPMHDPIDATIRPSAVLPAQEGKSAAMTQAPRSSSPVPDTGVAHSSSAVQHSRPVTDQVVTSARDLSTPQLRQAYYHELLQQTPAELWQQWAALARRKDSGEFAWLVTALGYRLRAEPDAEIYRALGERLQSQRLPLQERLGVVNALMFAASHEAVELLVAWMQANGSDASATVPRGTPEADEMSAAVRRALLEASRTSVNGSRNWALSPLVERAWISAQSGTGFSPAALYTLGEMLAYLGRPEGVSVLVDSAARFEPTDSRHQAAIAALAQVRALDPVPVLGEALRTHSGNDVLTQTMVRTLLSIGSGGAVQEVFHFVDFPQTTPDARAKTLALLDDASGSPDVAKAMSYWRSQTGRPRQ